MAWFAGSNFKGAHDEEECVSCPASSYTKWRCSFTSTDWCCEDHRAATQTTTWAIWGLVAHNFNENMGYILAPTSSWLSPWGKWFGQSILAKDVEEVLGHLQVNWPTACHIFFFSDTRYVVPYCFHGDEGRGSGRVPFLVLSWQPIVGLKGLDQCNDSS